MLSLLSAIKLIIIFSSSNASFFRSALKFLCFLKNLYSLSFSFCISFSFFTISLSFSKSFKNTSSSIPFSLKTSVLVLNPLSMALEFAFTSFVGSIYSQPCGLNAKFKSISSYSFVLMFYLKAQF